MAKRRKRTASGRFVSSKKSGGKRRRRGARRRKSTTRVSRRRRRGGKARRRSVRRRRNPGGSPLDKLQAAFGRATGTRRRRRKSSKRRTSSRRRRPRAVYVRRKRGKRRGTLRNLRRRVYTRSRKGKYKRANPGRGGGGSIYSRAFSLDTVIQVGQIGLGVLINQAAPIYIAKWTGRSDLNRGLMGGVAALGGNVAVAALLSLLGQKQLAYKTLVGGVLSSVGRVAQIGLGAINRRSLPAALPGPGAPVSGMGSIVSPESMVEAQALLGDFVQLSGGIPRRDFRGMGDYIEFKSQAAGANAMAAQLATSEVFSPGADEKF